MTVSITLVYDIIRLDEKMLIKAANQRKIVINTLDAKEVYLRADKSRSDIENKVDLALQRCVSHLRGIHLTALLEAKGIPVINSFKVASTCSNKLQTTLALMKAGVPTPETVVAFTPRSAMKAIQRVGYPALLKPVMGSWGRLVAPLNDEESAKAILEDREQMFPLYQIFYIQPRIRRPPRDIRTFVVGDRVIAAIYRYSCAGEWRTNTARGGTVANCPVTDELEDICLKAAEAVGGGVLGLDCMETPNGLVVHEVNDGVEFKNSVLPTGVDIPGLIIDYAISQAKR